MYRLQNIAGLMVHKFILYCVFVWSARLCLICSFISLLSIFEFVSLYVFVYFYLFFVNLCISKWHCLAAADCGVLQVGWFTNSICSICGKFRFYSNIKPPPSHSFNQLFPSFKNFSETSEYCVPVAHELLM